MLITAWTAMDRSELFLSHFTQITFYGLFVLRSWLVSTGIGVF